MIAFVVLFHPTTWLDPHSEHSLSNKIQIHTCTRDDARDRSRRHARSISRDRAKCVCVRRLERRHMGAWQKKADLLTRGRGRRGGGRCGGVSVRRSRRCAPGICTLQSRASVVLERGCPHAVSHRVPPAGLVSRSMHSLVSCAAAEGHEAARGRLRGAARSGVSAHDPPRLAVRWLAVRRWLDVLHLPRISRSRMAERHVTRAMSRTIY